MGRPMPIGSRDFLIIYGHYGASSEFYQLNFE